MTQSGDTPERAAKRKNDHIRLCATENVEGGEQRAFAGVRLVPSALPECDLADIDLGTTFLGRRFDMPLLITGMTGGVERGKEINETLAQVAHEFNIPMGLGSQKIMLADPSTRALFDVKKKVPNVFLMGNMGLVSFNYGVRVDDLKRLVDDLGLDAFALHLNPIQECVQPEGERNFRALAPRIAEVVRALPVPVMVKEVGCGVSARVFTILAECGVAAVDVGGQGGTSWSAIEGLRGDDETRRLGELFRHWGLGTEESLRVCRAVQERGTGRDVELVATGGLRDGLQLAKALALGARMGGVGLPFLRALVTPPEGLSPYAALRREVDFFRRSLAITMFGTGVRRPQDLPQTLAQSFDSHPHFEGNKQC